MRQRHKETIFEINEYPLKASKLSLKLPLPEKQIIFIDDASKHAAVYVLLIEHYADDEARETNKFAPAAFGSKPFTTPGKCL